MAEKVVLIRHCATAAGDGGLLAGSTDVPAHEAGLAEVESLGAVLDRYRPKKWFRSPLLRAEQTAARLQREFAIRQEFFVDQRLREIDFGRWEMKTFAEISAAEPELVDRWRCYSGFAFPGGEALAAFEARIADFLADLHREEASQVGIVSHGGVIRTLICLALGLEAANYLLFSVGPCRAAVIDLYPEGGVLAGLNL